MSSLSHKVCLTPDTAHFIDIVVPLVILSLITKFPSQLFLRGFFTYISTQNGAVPAFSMVQSVPIPHLER